MREGGMQEQPDHSAIIEQAALKSLASGVPELILGAKSVGMSERCIETPWFASRLTTAKHLLDIGWSFSPPEWFAVLLALHDEGVIVQGIDIIDPKRVQSRYPQNIRDKVLSIHTHVADFLSANLSHVGFDTITCLSTLEHIGIDVAAAPDNDRSAFDRSPIPEEVTFSRDPRTNERFLDSVARNLNPGGRLLVSVPIGCGHEILHQDSLGLFTYQFEFDSQSWSALTQDPRFELTEEVFFSYTEEGWQPEETAAGLERQSSELTDFATGVGLAELRRR